MANKIVIFSTKGGVGKTLIATNLAVSLSKAQGKRVCLVDLDLQAGGDMARMLELKPERGIADLAQSSNKQILEFKKDKFLIPAAGGIDFLCGVTKPRQSPHLKPEDIGGVFNLLDKSYDFLIIDTGTSFNDLLLAALSQANMIILVITPDILSVNQVKLALERTSLLSSE